MPGTAVKREEVSPHLATYADLVRVMDELPVILRAVRRARRLSQRQVAAQSGVAYSTISRAESGAESTTTSLRALLLWLDTEPAAELAGEVQS